MAKKESKTTKEVAKGIHSKLCEIMARELEMLPDTLDALLPPERIKAILQMLPYTAPKMDAVASDFNKVEGWDW